MQLEDQQQGHVSMQESCLICFIHSFSYQKNTKQDLSSKVNVLESRIQQLESVLVSMFPREKETASTHQTPVQNSLKSRPKSVGMARTCAELRAADPSASSGLHMIDPDGQGVGDDPISVYCDMTTGNNDKLFPVFFQNKTLSLYCLCRYDSNSSRQRFAAGCGPLRRTRMLFESN